MKSIATIKEFRGKYRFLSNFWFVRVLLDGVEYPSVEHAYQAAKSTDPIERQRVRAQGNPGQAKREGNHLSLRLDWNEVKESVMLDLLRQKFAQEPLRSMLLATGDDILQEGNYWGDIYWGVSPAGSTRGRNRLGVLLMQVRKELKLDTICTTGNEARKAQRKQELDKHTQGGVK